MASKKKDEREVVRWITVKGKHLPVYADGSFGVGKEDDKPRDYKSMSIVDLNQIDLKSLSKEEFSRLKAETKNISQSGFTSFRAKVIEESNRRFFSGESAVTAKEDDLRSKVVNKMTKMSGINKNTISETSQQIINGIKAGTIDENGAKAYGLSKKDYTHLKKLGNSKSTNTEKFLKETTAKQKELKTMFKNSPDTTLIATKKAQSGLVDEYTVSKSDKGISMSYRQTGKDGKSFGGGATTVKGYWDVAQRMNSMEKSGMKFQPATTSKNAKYDTSRSNSLSPRIERKAGLVFAVSKDGNVLKTWKESEYTERKYQNYLKQLDKNNPNKK